MSTLSWFVSQCLYFLEWFVFVGFSEAVGNRCNQGLSHLSLGARGNRFVCQVLSFSLVRTRFVGY
ncbi:unnamed protein product [Brassica napus]|uniref:(rape) hypothetical protein n=1 Tax=Brassica napus TaxID=3708 RepID=A0A816S6L3_BRANA|nr:unnamed protein product [Brassica napus]